MAKVNNERTTAISAQFYDAGDNDLITYTVLVNGNEVQSGISDGFTIRADDLSNGAVSVSVIVTDAAGNAAAPYVWTFTVDAPSQLLPSIIPLTPGDGSFTNDPLVEVSAAFLDNGGGIEYSTLSVTFGGYELNPSNISSAVTVTGTGLTIIPSALEWYPVGLPDGTYEVTVAITDSNFNPASATWSFSIDTIAPEFTAFAPRGGEPTSSTRGYIFAAFADDFSGIEPGTFEVDVHDENVVTKDFGDNGYGEITTAITGERQIVFILRVSDRAGNQQESEETRLFNPNIRNAIVMYPDNIACESHTLPPYERYPGERAVEIEVPQPLFFIPELNDELSKQDKSGATLPPDAAPGPTNIQDRAVWQSNWKTIGVKVLRGTEDDKGKLTLGMTSDELKIHDEDRLTPLTAFTQARCGDYPGNFWGHKAPEDHPEFEVYPCESVPEPDPEQPLPQQFTNSCSQFNVPRVYPAQAAEGFPCNPHVFEVSYKTGIKYGKEPVIIGANNMAPMEASKILLVRLDADGLKNYDPKNKNLDESEYPFSRTAFPDLVAQTREDALFILPSNTLIKTTDGPIHFQAAGKALSRAQGVLEYTWDFGDGTASFDEDPTHGYVAAGGYVVTLQVNDRKNGNIVQTWNAEFTHIAVETPDGNGLPVQPEFSDTCYHGVPIRISAKGPPGQWINVSVQAGGSIRVSLDGKFNGVSDLPLAFRMDIGAEGRGSTVVFVQGMENGDTMQDGTLTVKGEEYTWVVDGATLVRQWSWIVTDTEKTKITDYVEEPHDPGDYSVNSDGEDSVDNNGQWDATRYYFSLNCDNTGITDSTKAANEKYLNIPTSSSADFKVEVDRYMPNVNAWGNVTGSSWRYGAISKTARLRIVGYAFNTASNTITVAWDRQNLTTINTPVGPFLKEVELPVYKIYLAKQRGTSPTPEDNDSSRPEPNPLNQVRMSAGTNIKIVSVELSFDAMSPYVFVHGKGEDGRFFDGVNPNGIPCFTGITNTFLNYGFPFDNSIKLMDSSGAYATQPSQGSVQDQGEQIQGYLPGIVESFGSTHFNIVAHSKGGLDSRYWLVNEKLAADDSRRLILGEFVTLATPHKGSVIADYAYGGAQLPHWSVTNLYLQGVATLRYPFLCLAGIIDKVSSGSPACCDLQTVNMDIFNQSNLPALMAYVNPDLTKPRFHAVTGDADKNGDGKISLPTNYDINSFIAETAPSVNSEVVAYLGLAAFQLGFHVDFGDPHESPSEVSLAYDFGTGGGTVSAWLANAAVVGTIGPRVAYQALREIQSVSIVGDPTDETKAVVTELRYGPYSMIKNDFLVSRLSGECRGINTPFSAHFVPGKMHADIGDGSIGKTLLKFSLPAAK